MAFPGLPPKRAKPPLKRKLATHIESPRVSMQHERLIGRVVVVWSKIEAALDNIIWELASVDMAIGRYLTRQFGAEAKIKVTKVIAGNVLIEQEYKNLELILNSVSNCQEDRNFIMHAAWGTQNFGAFTTAPVGLSTRSKSDHPDRVVGESFSSERMHQIINDGIACLRALIAFLDALETSPDRFRRPPDPD